MTSKKQQKAEKQDQDRKPDWSGGLAALVFELEDGSPWYGAPIPLRYLPADPEAFYAHPINQIGWQPGRRFVKLAFEGDPEFAEAESWVRRSRAMNGDPESGAKPSMFKLPG